LFGAAILFGVVVHVRIYPIIYVLPILVLLDEDYGQILTKNMGFDTWFTTATERLPPLFKQILNWQRVLFGLVSGGVFFAFCGIFYYVYGMTYLQESLFYHLTRSDHRHNFSIYFYSIYLNEGTGMTVIERLLAFVPQMSVQLVFVFFFARDLPFCLFVQTFAFVGFNKVSFSSVFSNQLS
jgi:phosphatidylinositol glycan class M